MLHLLSLLKIKTHCILLKYNVLIVNVAPDLGIMLLGNGFTGNYEEEYNSYNGKNGTHYNSCEF